MSRRRVTAAIVVAIAAGFLAVGLRRVDLRYAVWSVPLGDAGSTALALVAILAGAYALYAAVLSVAANAGTNRRRYFEVRSTLRLAVSVLAAVAVLGLLTDQWLGALVSLGVVGVALTLAVQQPLGSLLGWFYIMTKHPYRVGDRVRIGDVAGDVAEVSFLVTRLWEIDGDLVSTNQPNGRLVTVPNRQVMEGPVRNFSSDPFPYLWGEVTVQVAYETDLDFAVRTMTEVADGYLGDEMADIAAQYRAVLDETPVDLDVTVRPTVSVVQQESWVTLRLRFAARPREMTHTRTELLRRVLDAFNDAPERVQFPVGRNR